MQGSDIYEILKRIGVTHLHQANSVMTSCTYLQQGGIVSRGFAEDHRLQQSAQPTDELDRKYGIWHTIFVPHVDIHARQGQTKAPNLFGPVLFVLDLDVLLRLPPGAEVRVTKRSPAYWYDTEPDSARWFQNAEEVAQNLSADELHKMPAIQIPSGRLGFPNRQARIILDDPQRQLQSGVNAYIHAEARLREAASHGKVEVSIERRKCQMGCICVSKYATWEALTFNSEADWEIAVAIFQDRINTRYLEHIERIIGHRTSGFAVLTLDCALIETLEQFRQGTEETPWKQGEKYFVSFLRGTSFKEHVSADQASLFYTNIRCGLLHQGEAKSSLVKRSSTLPLISFTERP